MATFTMNSNDPWLRFQGHAEYLRNGTQLQRNTNRNLQTPYSRVLFRMTLSDLAK